MADQLKEEARKVGPIVLQIVNAFLANLSRAEFPFPTADEAAVAALDEIYLQSIAQHVEFAGRIFQRRDGSFFFSKANKGSRDESDPGFKRSDVANVGTYHSHGGEFQPSDELFSPRDKLKAELGKDVSYLITPRRKILKYFPISLTSPSRQGLGTETVLRVGMDENTAPFRLHQQLFSPQKLQKQGSTTLDQAGAVVAIQALLNRRPPTTQLPLIEDGIFGPKTLGRVREFQQNNALVPDGVVGPKTRSALFGVA